MIKQFLRVRRLWARRLNLVKVVQGFGFDPCVRQSRRIISVLSLLVPLGAQRSTYAVTR